MSWLFCHHNWPIRNKYFLKTRTGNFAIDKKNPDDNSRGVQFRCWEEITQKKSNINDVFIAHMSRILPWRRNITSQWCSTPPMAEIIWVKNVRAIVFCGFLMKWLKEYILKIWKKSWVPFGSFLLNSAANPAHFHSSWVGLAVLFSR